MDFYADYIKIHGLPKGCPNESCRVIPMGYDTTPDLIFPRQATLQNYWRDQEKNLFYRTGQKSYTQAHLPMHYSDGTETWKANQDHENWHALSDLVKERLACGAKTIFFFQFEKEVCLKQDRRANFRGCVLPYVPGKVQFSYTEEQLEKKLGTSTDANRVLHLSLFQAAILKPQNFFSSTFGSSTNFKLTLFSTGETDFSYAKFSGGQVTFEDAIFAGGHVDFHGATFSETKHNFENTQFSGGNASFDIAEFSGGETNFKNANFSGGSVSFNDTQFSGRKTTFNNTQFSGEDASFENAQFERSFSFHGAQFSQKVSFENTFFPPSEWSIDAFQFTRFVGPVKFNRTKFYDVNDNPLPASDLNFPFNAFGFANFKDQVILTQRGDEAAQIEFDRAIKSTEEASYDDGQYEGFIEARYVALESGCTTLKRAVEGMSDKNRAQRYFKFELLARQRRPSTPRIVKFFTRLYGLTADYGGSISRPQLTLLTLWLGFAVIYGLNAQIADIDVSPFNKIWGALDFSATHIFRPLFIWSKSGSGDAMSWLVQYRAGLSAGGWLSIKLLATLQSFLSLTLLFLFGLATKRKFQIN